MNSKHIKRLKTIAVIGSLFFVAVFLFSSCREDGPEFSHKKHVVDQQVSCDTCHPGGGDGVKMGAPTVETCGSCHEEAKVYAAAADKLAKSWPRFTALAPDNIFAHKNHLDAGVKCESCHGDIGNSKKVSQSNMPNEATCLGCHEQRGKGADCATCHQSISRDNPPPSHKQNYLRFHGDDALDSVVGDRCERCHARTMCDNCHKVEKPIDHNSQWREFSHGAEMRFDSNRCATCHRTDFCATCHRETRPRSHSGNWSQPYGGRHCVECHVPADDKCAVCHGGRAPHVNAPARPAGGTHALATDCRTCHNGFLLKHPDNGENCLSCHR